MVGRVSQDQTRSGLPGPTFCIIEGLRQNVLSHKSLFLTPISKLQSPMKLSLHPFRLKLRHPFGISRGVTTVQGTLVVELEQDGLRGYGEVTEAKYYGVTVEGMAERLEAIRGKIESASVEDPVVFWNTMNEALGGRSAV